MILEGLTLSEYLAPRMKPEKKKKEKFVSKRSLVESYYIESKAKPLSCAVHAGCCDTYARKIISKIKKAAVG